MMPSQEHQFIELREYQAELFKPQLLSYEFGDSLWRNYKNVVDIDFPSPKRMGRPYSFGKKSKHSSQTKSRAYQYLPYA